MVEGCTFRYSDTSRKVITLSSTIIAYPLFICGANQLAKDRQNIFYANVDTPKQVRNQAAYVRRHFNGANILASDDFLALRRPPSTLLRSPAVRAVRCRRSGTVVRIDVNHPRLMAARRGFFHRCKCRDDHDIVRIAFMRGGAVEANLARSGGCGNRVGLQPLAVGHIPHMHHLVFEDARFFQEQTIDGDTALVVTIDAGQTHAMQLGSQHHSHWLSYSTGSEPYCRHSPGQARVSSRMAPARYCLSSAFVPRAPRPRLPPDHRSALFPSVWLPRALPRIRR